MHITVCDAHNDRANVQMEWRHNTMSYHIAHASLWTGMQTKYYSNFIRSLACSTGVASSMQMSETVRANQIISNSNSLSQVERISQPTAGEAKLTALVSTAVNKNKKNT